MDSYSAQQPAEVGTSIALALSNTEALTMEDESPIAPASMDTQAPMSEVGKPIEVECSEHKCPVAERMAFSMGQ